MRNVSFRYSKDLCVCLIRTFLIIIGKRQSSEDEATVSESSRSSNESFSQKLTVQLSFKDECLPFSSKEHYNKIMTEEVDQKRTDISTSSQLSSQRSAFYSVL